MAKSCLTRIFHMNAIGNTKGDVVFNDQQNFSCLNLYVDLFFIPATESLKK